MPRLLPFFFLLALVVAACGDDGDGDQTPAGSDRHRIRQVIEESEFDRAHAHDVESAEWCDTRLVLPYREGRNLYARLEAGIRGPREERELKAAASEARCLKWAEALSDALEEEDEEELEASGSDLWIIHLKVRGDTASAMVYSGEGEDRGSGTWRLVELTEGDWRVLQESEVPNIL